MTREELHKENVELRKIIARKDKVIATLHEEARVAELKLWRLVKETQDQIDPSQKVGYREEAARA